MLSFIFSTPLPPVIQILESEACGLISIPFSVPPSALNQELCSLTILLKCISNPTTSFHLYQDYRLSLGHPTIFTRFSATNLILQIFLSQRIQCYITISHATTCLKHFSKITLLLAQSPDFNVALRALCDLPPAILFCIHSHFLIPPFHIPVMSNFFRSLNIACSLVSVFYEARCLCCSVYMQP